MQEEFTYKYVTLWGVFMEKKSRQYFESVFEFAEKGPCL